MPKQPPLPTMSSPAWNYWSMFPIPPARSRPAKPGGRLFFSTINRNPKSYLFAVIGAEYLLKMLPKGTHDYARFIKPSELSRWCRAAELRAEELIGMTYNPLSRIYRLGADCDVNYLMRCVRE